MSKAEVLKLFQSIAPL